MITHEELIKKARVAVNTAESGYYAWKGRGGTTERPDPVTIVVDTLEPVIRSITEDRDDADRREFDTYVLLHSARCQIADLERQIVQNDNPFKDVVGKTTYQGRCPQCSYTTADYPNPSVAEDVLAEHKQTRH